MSSTVFYADTNELAVLTNTWTVNGTPTDPTTVSLIVTDPLSVATTYTYGGGGSITRVSAGVYTQSVPSPTDGLWSYVWVGTGTASDVAAGTWTVMGESRNQFYTSVEELKSRLNITDSQNDHEITWAVEAAAADIEQFTGRFFYQTPAGTSRTYRNDNIYDVEIDDVVSVSQLATDANGFGTYDTVWTATQFQLAVTEHQYNTSSKGEAWPYTKIQALGVPGGLYLPYVWAWRRQDAVKVTGVFGWPKVPRNVREASLILAVDHFKRKDAPFGIAGFSEYGPVRIAGTSPVAALLHRYVRSRTKVGV